MKEADLVKDLGRRVLVVEDNALNLKLYLIALRPVDADILVAKDGIEALAQIEREHPDLVILDIQLPGKSGILRHAVPEIVDPTRPRLIYHNRA